MTTPEQQLLEKKLHNVQRTKLRLKKSLNTEINKLQTEIENLKERCGYVEALNKEYSEKMESLKWATDWEPIN